MLTIIERIEDLNKAVLVLEERLKEAEKIESPVRKNWELLKIGFLKKKLMKRAMELDKLVRSGKAFE